MPNSFLAIACKKFYGFIRVFQEYQIYPFKTLLKGFPPKPLLVLQGFLPTALMPLVLTSDTERCRHKMAKGAKPEPWNWEFLVHIFLLYFRLTAQYQLSMQ